MARRARAGVSGRPPARCCCCRLPPHLFCSSPSRSSLTQSYLTHPPLAPTPTQVFLDSTLPVVQHYEAGGKVARINADRDPADIYKEVRRLFLEF